MDPTRISTQVCVKHCSLCQGDTEYHCHHCQHNLCLQCKRKHVIDIDTKDHEVTRYAEKPKILPKQVTSARSGDSDNREPCEAPVSDPCPEHVMSARSRDSDNQPGFPSPVWLPPLEDSRHDEIERRRHSERIYRLRGETLYDRHVLLEGLRHDVRSGHKEVTIRGQGKAKERAQGLKNLIDEVLTGNLYDRCQIQKTRLSKHIEGLEKNERRYEEYSCRLPVEYLRFIKHKPDPRKNEQKLIKILVQMMKRMKLSTETRKRQVGIELLLTLLPSPVLQKSTTVKGVDDCVHISCVTPDRVWVSDYHNLILTDTTTGDKLHSVEDSLHISLGIHTVNSECELIYIDKDRNINKLFSDMKTTTRFIKKPESPLERPQCMYCSPSSGDLLVAMCRYDRETRTLTGEVWRYNNTGKLTQTIPHDNTQHELYQDPLYITENNNGDVVVSDNYRDAVVVTDREGRHRFSYTGPPSGSRLHPHGICTDALSHILISDWITRTVQMINKDGDFLSYLLTTESPGIHHDGPRSLSYDVNTHTLYVGSRDNNTVSVYRHINRHLTITDNVEVCDDSSVRRSSPTRSVPGYSQEEFDLFSAKEKARKAAEEAEKIAARAEAAATKATEAVVKATEGTEERIEEEAAAKAKKKAASEAAEKAASEAAAAKAAANAATTAETVEAAEEAAKAATEAKTRAEVATESILNDDLYDDVSDYSDSGDDADDLSDDQYDESYEDHELRDDLLY